MNDRNKTIMTHYDDLPFVQASLVAIDAEPLTEIRTEYVVIDEYFESHNSYPELSLESNHSSHSIAASSEQIINPNDLNSNSNENRDHPHDFIHQCHLEEESTSSSVQYSKVDQSKTFGAWAAGIVLGFLVGAGPSLSMAFGFGAAYFSQQEEGVAGDVARAIGDVALLSHEKFAQVNEKHNLIDNVANGTVAFSRNFLIFTSTHIDSLFSVVDKKNRNSTRQMSTEDAKTT